MKLKIKFLKWSAGFPVVMLNKNTAERIGVYHKDRIIIKTLHKNPRKISTIVNIVGGLVGEKEIAVSFELKEILNLKTGQQVDVSISPSSKSLFFIRKKLDNKRLSKQEIDTIVGDIAKNSLSEAEIALFISAMYKVGMDMEETIHLVNAIFKSGNSFRIKNKYVVDKHCIGGIPGNRTTPIVVSICAAAGLIIPKTSSRAITSAAGTADVIETIAKVEFSIKDLNKIVKKTNGCLIWGGGLGMVPVDSKIIRIEKMLEIDPEAQLLSSIMSKKLAAGSKYILIDIPYGKTAKVNKRQALKLKRKFEYLGRHFNKKIKVVLTDGRQPIGNGIGPVLELIDIINILKPKEKGPEDLEKKSLFLAGQIFEMTGKAKKGEGVKIAREILYSGRAYEKFKEIIKAQKGNLKRIKFAEFKKDILSKKTGKIKSIDNKIINSLTRVAGCPVNKSSGLYLYHHIGEKVKKNDKILTIYSNSKLKLNEAAKFFKSHNPITIN